MAERVSDRQEAENYYGDGQESELLRGVNLLKIKCCFYQETDYVRSAARPIIAVSVSIVSASLPHLSIARHDSDDVNELIQGHSSMAIGMESRGKHSKYTLTVLSLGKMSRV